MEMNRKVIELNIDDVLPNRFQPRIKFSEDAITELSNSIKEHGVIQPIVVRPIGDKYEIIAGERRYKASCMAGLQTIPAIITDLNDKDSAEVALIENVQRENLTPIEEAISYKKILDMGYITQEGLAAKLGKTQSTVANKLRLLNLDDEVQEALLKEKISERHARSLLKLNDKEQQRQILKRIIEERLPVRRADEEIEKLLKGDAKNETVEPDNAQNKFINENIQENKEQNTFIQENENEQQNINNINVQDINTEQESVPSIFGNTLDEVPKDAEKPTFKFINFQQEEEPQINNNPIENSTPVENNNEEIKPGKFFNILNEEEPKEEPVPEQKFNFDKLFMNPTSNSSTNSMQEEIDEIEQSINNSSKKEPNIDTIPTENIETTKEIEQNPIENNNDDFDDFDADFEPISEEEPLPPQPEIINEPKFINPQITNFKDVLNKIRTCSNDIEKAGYKIDTEEYDLEGMYQVVFKITKED